MRIILIRSVFGAAALTIIWLAAGRRLSVFVDRFFTLPLPPATVSSVQYDGGGFRIGAFALTFAGTDNLPFKLDLQSDSRGRVILSTGGQSFPLGLRTNPVDPSGRPEIDFVAEPGDRAALTARRSPVGWPALFEFNIMKSHSPWWKRYVYYRLVWTKSSGAQMEMTWRYQQDYRSPEGWTEPHMLFNFQTGLLRVDIRHASPAVVRYIERTKGWKPNEYRAEARGASADGGADIVAIIHLDDEQSVSPGAGKSVELYVDRSTRRVLREIAGQ